MDFKLINVGIADTAISTSPNVLRTILGSCVGICLYHAGSRTGGMAHIMLPEPRSDMHTPHKYASTAIPLMLEGFYSRGIERIDLSAKIIGGATMFNLSENSMMSEIGRNNIKKVKEILDENRIALVAEDTGGTWGRTVDFYLSNGEIKIKSMNKTERII